MATETTSLQRHLTRLRWALPLIVLALAAFHQSLLYALWEQVPPAWYGPTQLAVYGVTGILVAWIGLTWIIRAVAAREKSETDLRQAYADLERTNSQLQTIHEIGRRVTDAADIQELLDLAARTPVELLNALGSTVITFEQNSGRVNLEMTWGLGEPAVTALRRRLEAGLPAEICAHCRPLTAKVTEDCPLLSPLSAAGCAGDIRQVVCLPLARSDERRLGVIATYMREEAAPPEQQLHLLNILAAEITAALEGVRLRARQMATLYAVDRATQDRQDVNGLLERVLETTMTGWGVSAGAILLVDETGTWDVRAHRGLGEGYGPGSSLPLHSPGFGLALRLAEETRATGQTIIPVGRGDQPGVTGSRLASPVAAPLQADGETLGALFLAADQPEAFTAAQTNLLGAVAHQIALAVRNAQLYSRLRQMAVLEERYRLSREMHDGLAQTLGYLGMELERLEGRLVSGNGESLRPELIALRRDVAESYLDVREAIDGLRLPIDDQPGGVARALQELVDDFVGRTGLAAECVCADAPENMPPEAAFNLLQIARESLANVRRHAHARRVRVQLTQENGLLELTVADDGLGFDPGRSSERHHHGLAMMRERIHGLGGQVTLATSPGQGTRVVVRVPL